MVLNNMSQGVLMFAPDTRLVFCNRRYCEMYGLSPGSITPGMTIRDLLQRRAAARTFAGDPEEYGRTGKDYRYHDAAGRRPGHVDYQQAHGRRRLACDP